MNRTMSMRSLARLALRERIRGPEMVHLANPDEWVGIVPTHCHVCDAELEGVFFDCAWVAPDLDFDTGEEVLRKVEGPHGIACPTCHRKHGAGVGPGLGQKWELLFGAWICTEGM